MHDKNFHGRCPYLRNDVHYPYPKRIALLGKYSHCEWWMHHNFYILWHSPGTGEWNTKYFGVDIQDHSEQFIFEIFAWSRKPNPNINYSRIIILESK